MSVTETKLVKLIAPQPLATRGHGTHICVTSKGDRMMYGSGWSVFWRSLEDMSECDSFTEHIKPVRSAVISPNGRWVASGDETGQLKTWEIGNKKVKLATGVLNKVNDIAWGPDSKRILIVGDGNPLKGKAISYDSGNSIGGFDRHSKDILAVACKETRPFRAVSCSEDMRMNIYSAFPVKYQKKPDADSPKGKHTRYPNCVRFAPDGSSLITVGSDTKIFVCNPDTGEFVKELKDKKMGHKACSIYSFSYSPDSKQILTVGSDKTAKIWDIESGEVKTSFDWNKSSRDVGHMLVSTFWIKGKAKEYLGTLALNGEISFLDPADSSKPAQTVHGVTSIPTSVVADRKGGKFYVGEEGGKVTAYDFKSGAGQWIKGDGHIGKKVVALGISDGALVSTGWDNTVQFSDTKSLEYGDSVSLPSQPTGLAVGKKDSGLVVVSLGKGAVVVIRGKKVVSTLEVSYSALSIDINADDTEVTVGGKDKAIHTYTLAGDKLTEKHVDKEASTKPVTLVVAHPSLPGKVASANSGAEIFLSDGQKIKNGDGWEYHHGTIRTGAWSPDGKRLATGAMDEVIIVFSDLDNYKAKVRESVSDNAQGVVALTWWDDETIIACAYDMSIKIFKVAPKAE